MEWTREQTRAIETKGTDILVAAGAGSGKTTVLVERIMRSVFSAKDPVDVDSLLVVTFTRAAAAEMRAKLSLSMDKMMENADEPRLVARIYDQQVRLQRSWITTIDSFCKRVLTENLKESGIDSSYTVCDDALRSELLSKAVEDAAEKLSIEKPEEYSALIDAYGNYKSDEELLECVQKTIEQSLSFPDPCGWILRAERSFSEPFENGDFLKTAWGRWLLDIIRLKFDSLLGEFQKLRDQCDVYDLNKYALTLDDDIERLKGLIEKIGSDDITWTGAYNACAGLNFSKLASEKKAELGEASIAAAERIQKKRNAIKKDLTEKTLNRLFTGSAEAPEEDRVSAAGGIRTFTELFLTAYELFAAAKAEKHVYDYGDMEHKCLELFIKKAAHGAEDAPDLNDERFMPEPSELALSYRRKFTEIYVDEYQDTNMLQEYILKLISGDGSNESQEAGASGPHLFMVGDMKQSIYSFRNACPELFMEKYGNYYDEERNAGKEPSKEPSKEGTLIRLNANFRSRREVVDSVNMIFSKIMNNDTCGMPYGTDEYLNFGASDYPDVSAEADSRTEIVVIDPGKRGQGADKITLEGYEILCRIKEMIGAGYPVYDKELKATRPVEYRDICILMRSLSPNGGKLANVLRSGGVPVSDVDDRAGLFLHPEMRVILSFLRIIDNPLNDIPLASVLKNVYGFTGDDLLRIKFAVRERNVPFYRRMRQFALSGAADPNSAPADGADPGLAGSLELARAFLERFEYLRKESLRRPPVETVWECLGENGFLEGVRALPDGGVAFSNVMRFIKIASEFEDSGGGSFCEFIRFLDMLEENGKISSAAPSGAGRNAVSICTIHQSKGLEYPVVILAEAGRSRNRKDESRQRMLTHKELGFGPCCFDARTRTVYHSIMREAVRLRIERDARAEELRILYVAMTRAKEKLIITGIGTELEKFKDECASRLDPSGRKPADYYTLGADDFLTLLGMAALCIDSELGRSCALVPGTYAQELLSGLSDDNNGGGSGAYGGGNEEGPGSDNDDFNAETDDEGNDLFRLVLRFGLPQIGRWSGSSGAEKADGEALFCPSKVSVSEIKRLSDTSESEAEEDSAMSQTAGLYRENVVLRMFDLADGTSGAGDDTASGKESGKVSGKVSGTSTVKGGAARTGTLLHCCLEHVDFEKVKNIGGERDKAEEYALSLVKELEERRFFTHEDSETIPVRTLAAFIYSDFALRMAAASSILREIPFALDYPSDELLGEPSFAGNTTTVQGIIDCVCLYGDGSVALIDYKSDTVNERVRAYAPPGEGEPGGSGSLTGSGGSDNLWSPGRTGGSGGRDFSLHSERYAVQLSIYSDVIKRMFGKYPETIKLYYLKYGKEFEIPAEMMNRWKK